MRLMTGAPKALLESYSRLKMLLYYSVYGVSKGELVRWNESIVL